MSEVATRIGPVPSRSELTELVPVLRRAVELDPSGLARIRVTENVLSVLIRLPFDVLVGRGIPASTADPTPTDVTVAAGDLLDWYQDHHAAEPVRRDHDWRGALPPARGWRRLDHVPEAVVRGLVRAGAATLAEAAARDGAVGAEPRAEVADALLDAVVLTVTGEPAAAAGPAVPGSQDPAPRAEITLRTVSALARMGFLGSDEPGAAPAGVAVDVCGRWTRLAARYGSAYAEAPGAGLTVLRG